MSVRKSDIMLLEGWMKSINKRMPIKIMDQPSNMNTGYDNPVLINWGSNGFYCSRDDLAPLIDAMEDEHTTPGGFLEDEWKPFLRQFADV